MASGSAGDQPPPPPKKQSYGEQMRHCFRTKKQQYKPTIYDLWSSYEVEPGVRANISLKSQNGQPASVPERAPHVTTVWNAFLNGLKVSAKDNCLGWRVGNAYSWWNYEEVAERVRKVAAGLARCEHVKRQDRVGIYSGTKPDWVVTALGLTSRALTIVPLYDTLGAESCSYVINQAEMGLLFVDSSAAAKRILSNAETTPLLRTIVIFTEPEAEVAQLAAEKNVSLITMEKFTAGTDGDTNPYDPPLPEDVFIFLYTSGTTGDPKGVILKHSSIIADVNGGDSFFANDLLGPDLRLSKKDVCLQYLPLAHGYGLLVTCWWLYMGASMGFYSGNVMKLMEDASILKPTYMTMVPRLLNRVYSGVMGQLEQSKIKSKLFWHAYAKKKELMVRGIITRTSFWDKLVFNKIQNMLGGRVWFMTVGSAPIAAEVLEFCRIVFGSLILEGYGQTECTAAATVAAGPVGGNVGHPISANYVKLADVPECGYFVKDGKGEVCIKGPNLMVGYYKLPDKTAEALDNDGWLHTGDIGEFMADGALRIVDRKKNIFKLAQGEYIAPEKIENVYVMCPKIVQVFVDGNSLESYTVAVVVPEPQMAATWATEHNVDPKDVTTNQAFIKYIYDALVAIGKENKLNSLEQVKAIHLSTTSFTVENGLITPTLKNKRPELRKFFKDKVEALYRAGPFTGEGGAAK